MSEDMSRRDRWPFLLMDLYRWIMYIHINRVAVCLVLAALCMGLFPTSFVHAKEYHVSVDGSGAAEGTFSKPFRTVAYAARIAQPGDTVTVHQGAYREWIDPLNGGESNTKRILYRAAEDEKVEAGYVSNFDEVLSHSVYTTNSDMDYLTALRVYLYIRVFAGIGFDISVLAFKIGVFGQLGVDLNFHWLNRDYLDDPKNVSAVGPVYTRTNAEMNGQAPRVLRRHRHRVRLQVPVHQL